MESRTGKGKKIHDRSVGDVPPPRRVFSQEERDRALALVASGVKRVKIAQEIGSTTEAIRLWLKKARDEGRMPAPDSSIQRQPPDRDTQGWSPG